MGICYKYVGEASYSRSLREKYEILEKVFGIVEHKNGTHIIPDNTDPVIVTWMRTDIDEPMTREETNHLWHVFQQHPEIETISNQIFHEVKLLAMHNDYWEVG